MADATSDDQESKGSGDKAVLGPIAPLLISADLRRALAFYDKIGFTTHYAFPEADPFFAIVGRGGAIVHLKEVDVEPQPNPVRDPNVQWDAFVFAPDPDTLAEEFRERSVRFHIELADREDQLRGFAVADADGYVLFFGRPVENEVE